MDSLLRDLKISTRPLLKYPGFAAVAILTLALGIAANTTIFSTVDAPLVSSLVIIINQAGGFSVALVECTALHHGDVHRMEIIRTHAAEVDKSAAHRLHQTTDHVVADAGCTTGLLHSGAADNESRSVGSA